MTEFLASDEPGSQKRRSTRISQAVPVTVTGVDALGQPFKERTTTVGVNCHGCKYQSKHYVPKGSVLTLEIPRPESGQPPRNMQGRVIWVQRPRTVRELFQIGVEFDIAGNIWGIAFPPDDWFPYPDDVPAEQSAEALVDSLHSSPETNFGAPRKHEHENLPPSMQIPLSGGATTPATSPTASAADAATQESKIHVVPPATPSASPSAAPAATAGSAQDAQAASARQVAKLVADAKETLEKTVRRSAQTAINEEMTVVRQQMDAQMHEAVERAIKVSMERVSESTVRKVVQQAADKTSAIVDEARRATNASTAQIDAKVRDAVQDAVGGAAQEMARQAAQQAAEQATSTNLKQAVEETVARLVAEREAESPSLQILTSPDSAQAQLDQWKRKLEETARSTRDQALSSVQADTAAAGQKILQDVEAALAGSQANLQQKLAETAQATLEGAVNSAQLSVQTVSGEAQRAMQAIAADLEQERLRAEATKSDLESAARNALAKAEEEFAEKSMSLRAALDEALAHAQSSVQSIAGEAENVVKQVRSDLDQLAATKSDEIARRADELIQERTQLVEPMLRSSAESVLAHFSAEIDEKVAPRVADAQRAAAELENATQQAAQIRESIVMQSREASEQAVAESMARLREEAGKVPGEIEEAARLALSKATQDLDQKASETQHETFEALLKASDWYQKKAHTNMQTALEKTVEQSTSTLRDRAAEISSLAASELDHQRRAYVNHAQAQIEETAKEVVDRERGKLTQNAEIASTGFTNRINELTTESFKAFEESSRAALEKARSDMEFAREGSFIDYDKKLEERLAQGIKLARTQIQAQLVPLMEEWDAERESEKRAWMDQVKKQSEEAVETYKTRLENASNSWLLASAATLGQNSQAMLDTISKAAEKRIRETCADVLAGMGDTLKARLLGLSSGFAPEPEEDNLPPKPPSARKQ